MIMMLSVIGLIWLYISFNKWKKAISAAYSDKNYTRFGRIKNTIRTVRHNPYGKDVKISLLFTILGGVVFAGVTGMMIGLISSAIISFVIWASHKVKAVNRITNLAD